MATYILRHSKKPEKTWWLYIYMLGRIDREFEWDLGRKEQIRGSTKCGMVRIVEGFGRRISKELAKFRVIADSSAAETQPHLDIALGL